MSQTRLCTGGPAPERQLCTRARPLGHGRLRTHSPAAAPPSLGPGCGVQATMERAAGVSPARTQPWQAPPRPRAPAPGEAFRARPPKAELDSSREPGGYRGPGSRRGRGAGRAWLDPGRPPSERKACPRCPRAPPRGGAKVREAGARAAQAQTIRDSSGDGARPGRQAALVLVIGYGRAGELRQRVLDTH